jgi:hypothetical protein
MKNTVILMQSRTASSLVAAAFRAHGWASGGETVTSQTSTARYVTHESQAIKKHLVGRYGTAMPEPVPWLDAADENLRQIVAGQFGTKPWVWKGDAYYFEAFKATFDDLAIVYVKRFIPDAVRSSLSHRDYNVQQREHEEVVLSRFLRVKYDYMVDLESAHGGKVVYTTDVLKGELATMRQAIEYAGGTWDAALVDQVIARRG